MLDILKSKFKNFDPDTFDFFENTTYVVLVRYHKTNQLGFATVSVDEQECFHDASKYHHLYKKKYTMDQFSVVKIADLNYGFSELSFNLTAEQLNDSWNLITSPVTKIASPCWGVVLIKRPSFFGEDENKDHWLYVLAKISADQDDPLYGLYMTIYHEKKLTNFAMDVLVEDIGIPYAYKAIKLEQLTDWVESTENVYDTQHNIDDHKEERKQSMLATILCLVLILCIIGGILWLISAIYRYIA